MERRLSWLMIAAIVVPLVLIGVVPAFAEGNGPTAASSPESVILDAQAARQVAELGKQMQDYLSLNDDGTLAVGEVNRDKVAVDEEYLENYRAAVDYVNGAIQEGLFEVDENFQIVWPENDQQLAPVQQAPPEASPEWYGYRTSHGLYIYFTYDDVYHYLPHYGLSTALSLASYCGRPWVSVPYTYQFTYYNNYRYFHRHAYPGYGLWVYAPWSDLGYYSCCYQRTYRYLMYWYPYGRYWYYHLGYW